MSYGATIRAGTGNAVGAAGTASSVRSRSQPLPRVQIVMKVYSAASLHAIAKRLGCDTQFWAEAFNVTNTRAFNNPNADASTPVRAADGTITSLNNVSSVTQAFPTERQIHFALKFLF